MKIVLDLVMIHENIFCMGFKGHYLHVHKSEPGDRQGYSACTLMPISLLPLIPQDPITICFVTAAGITGHIITIVLFLMVTSSLEFIRYMYPCCLQSQLLQTCTLMHTHPSIFTCTTQCTCAYYVCYHVVCLTYIQAILL